MITQVKKYIVLEHLTLPDRGGRFWSMNSDNEVKVGDKVDGTKENPWYKVILLTDDDDQALRESMRGIFTATSEELMEYWKMKISERENNES